jgi:hypothetical protein
LDELARKKRAAEAAKNKSSQDHEEKRIKVDAISQWDDDATTTNDAGMNNRQ